MKRLKKILIVLAFIAAVAAGMYLFLQTTLFRSWAAQTISETVSKSLNGRLVIGSIEGNILGEFHLTHSRLMQLQDTLLYIPKISLKTEPRYLLRKTLFIHHLTIEKPHVTVVQNPDGSWAVAQLIPKENTAPRETKPIPWGLVLKKGSIDNGKIKIASIDSTFPQAVDSLMLTLSGCLNTLETELNLSHFSFHTIKPEFHLLDLTFRFSKNDSGLSLNNLQIKTARNQAQVHAVRNPDTGKSRATLATTPVDMKEFQFLLPSLHLPGQPKFTMKTTINNDRLNGHFVAKDSTAIVSLETIINNVSSLWIDSTKVIPEYEINGSIQNVDVMSWIGKPKTKFILNADAHISGHGINPHTAGLAGTFKVYHSQYSSHILESLTMDSRYENESLTTELTAKSNVGYLTLQGSIKDCFDTQGFRGYLQIDSLKMNHLFKEFPTSSTFNLKSDIQGKSLSLDRLQGRLTVDLDSSSIADIPVYPSRVTADYNDKTFTVDTLQLKSELAVVEGNGIISLSKSSDFFFSIMTQNPDILKLWINADSVSGDIEWNNHIWGQMDSLNMKTQLTAEKLQYNHHHIGKLSLEGTLRKNANDFTSSTTTHAQKIYTPFLQLDDVILSAQQGPDSVDFQVTVSQHDSINSKLNAVMLLDNPLTLKISALKFKRGDQLWIGGSDSTTIILLEDELDIRHLFFKSERADGQPAHIYSHGILRTLGEQHFTLRMMNFDLGSLGSFMPKETAIGGLLNADMLLKGTAEQPNVHLNLQCRDALLNSWQSRHLDVVTQYHEQQLNTTVSLLLQNDSLNIHGILPMRFSLSPFELDIYTDRAIDLEIKADDVQIANVLPTLPSINHIQGIIDIHLQTQTDQSFSAWQPDGEIFLRKGAIRSDVYGVALDDIVGRIIFKQDSVILKQLQSRRNRGTLSVDGYTLLNESLQNGIVETIHVNISTDDLFLSTKPEHELQVASDLTVDGSLDSLVMDGAIQVKRASIFLPALAGDEPGPNSSMDLPALVQAMMDSAELVIPQRARSDSAGVSSPEIVKNLRGRIKVDFPRNVWIHSPNLRMELYGDLDINKSSDAFELFGTVRVSRGEYTFLGRRFKLVKGQVVFQGGEQINPVLDIQTQYTFRDAERRKRTLNLIISDHLLDVKIRFTLDDQELAETEAISYILFNRPPEQLSTGQASSTGIPSQTKYLANDLVYGALSAELSRRVGSSLGVDYIEIRGKDNLYSATFVVGKYLTPDLFMSYEHSLGNLEEDTSPRIVAVEYQLTKYIFLQLISGDTKTTGADIIFKFD